MTVNLGVDAVYAYRKNNIVQLLITGTYTGNASYGTQTLASGLPEKYRPKDDNISSSFSVVAYITSNPYVVPSRLAVHSNGVIGLNETAMPNGARMCFGVTYIVG